MKRLKMTIRKSIIKEEMMKDKKSNRRSRQKERHEKGK